jgi:hypothetical protein
MWQCGCSDIYFNIILCMYAETIYSPELGEVLLILFRYYVWFVSCVLAQVPLVDSVGE